MVINVDTKPEIPNDTSLSGNSLMANKRVYLEMDRISKLPHAIRETILCLVPIKDAARTAVLSKEWRYSWTKIPKLVFNGYFIEVETCPSSRNHYSTWQKVPYISLPTICKVLKMHEGTIDELTIEMNDHGIDDILDYLPQKIIKNLKLELLDNLLDYLPQKIIKKLKLELLDNCVLPSSLFSLTHLTGLCLISCALDRDSLGLDSLGRLKTLYLEDLTASIENLVYFVSKCPLLKTVTLMQNQYTKGGIYDTNTSTITDMFECLPMIENLSINSKIIECFPSIHGGPLKLPTGLVHLKYIYIEDMYFDYDYDQHIPRCRLGPVLGLLLRSSPHLERLVVTFGDFESSFRVEEYADIWLEHLSELKINYLTNDYESVNANSELEFVKLILAKSPVLKNLKMLVDEDEELLISKILSSSLHASPMVKIMYRTSRFRCC